MKFNIVKSDNDDENAIIELSEGKFAGISIKYGVIRLDEKEDSLVLNFDYDIVKGELFPSEKEEFNNVVGNLLVQFLEEQNGMLGDDFDGVIEYDGNIDTEESGNQ